MVAAFATTAQQLFAAHDKMQSNERLQNEGTKQQTILIEFLSSNNTKTVKTILPLYGLIGEDEIVE